MWSFSKNAIVAILAVSILSITPARADPIEVLSLWESPASGDPFDPWPKGLRLVVYDNGDILKLTRPFSETADALVRKASMSPAEAAALSADYLSRLAEVDANQIVMTDFPNRRRTVLRVWDFKRQAHTAMGRKWAPLRSLGSIRS